MARLNANTIVRGPKGQAVTLLKGSEVPEGVTVGDHLLVRSEADSGTSDEDLDLVGSPDAGDETSTDEYPDAEPSEDETSTDEYPDAEPSEDWTVGELRAYANDFEIDLHGAGNSKAKIVEKIREAQM